jgi:hypothetical protein
MLLHTMYVYSWLVYLIKEIEKWIKINFIWSSDINKRKLIIVPLKKACFDYVEVGLARN